MIPYKQQVEEAIIQNILQLTSPVTGLGIVPKTTLTSPATAGSNSITVADASHFSPNTILTFWDGSGEALILISAINGNVITLSFVNRGYTGLQFDHAAGSVVATNVFRHPIDTDITYTFGNGYPVIAAYILDDSDEYYTTGQMRGDFIASVAYLLPAYQQGDAATKMPGQIWTGVQMDRAENDLSTIRVQMRSNIRLRNPALSNAPTILQFVKFYESRRRVVDNPSTPVYTFLLDMHVTGQPQPISG